MTNSVLVQPRSRRIEMHRLRPKAAGRPPYLSGQVVGHTNISATALEEVRLALQELSRWEGAYDGNKTGCPDEYLAEIRLAEKRLRNALLSPSVQVHIQ